MAKQIIKYLDLLSPSERKLTDLPRKPDGLHNLKVNEYGQLVKRAGYAKHNTAAILPAGGSKIVGMHRFYKMDTSDKEFLVAWKQKIYQLPDNGGTAVALTDCPDLGPNADTYFCDFLNHCYFLNGVDGVFKYDRNFVRSITPPVPKAKPGESVVDSGGYLGIGDYKFCYTYVDEDGYEGNPSAVSDTSKTTEANSSVTVTIVNSTDKKITKRRVYRTSVGGAIYYYDGDVEFLVGTWTTTAGWTGTFATGFTHTTGTTTLSEDTPAVDAIDYFITYTVTGRTAGTFVITFGGKTSADISASGVWEPTASSTANLVITPSTDFDGKIVISINNTTFISSQADGTLGTIVKTNHTAPPLTSHLITKRRNKLYLAFEDYIYPSYTSDVEYFPPLWRLRTGNSQKIMGLVEQLTALPVATEDSIERLVGTDEDNFEFINSYSTEGNVAIRSYVDCDNLLVYLGYNGINYFDGVTSGIFSEAVNKYIKENINGAYRHLSCAAYWDNKYMLCYPKGANEVPSETIWIDLKNKTYGVYDFAFSCFSKWSRGTDGLRLFGGSNTIGRVYEIGKSTILTDYNETTETDDAITAYDDIEPIDLGLTEVYKQWYSIFIKIKTTDGTALAMFYTLDDNDETSSVIISRDDIAFVDGGVGEEDTITTTAGDFVAAGFVAGDVIVVTGDSENNGNYTIVSVVAKTINVATASLTGEIKGDDVVITKAKVLTANTTKWYRISLGSGGKRARTLTPRPYMSDKYYFEIQGYMVCYEAEPFAEEKE